MGVTRKIWIEFREKIEPKDPIAIVGSPGLRSVGKIAVDKLIEKKHPRLCAELYSYGFPGIYYGPSYLGAPSSAGVKMVKGNLVEIPKVEFYVLEHENHDIILTKGYQAYDALNQALVADKVIDLLMHYRVKKLLSLGAQVIEEGIRCCATDPDLLEEMAAYKIRTTNVDRFIGFSGLVVAMGKLKGIKGICLFANTTQNVTDPEYPDFYAAKELLDKLNELLHLSVDTSDLDEREQVKKEGRGELTEEEKVEIAGEDLTGYV
jgi:proteasome assembly chaperone (PAC2) family protein